MNTGLLLPESLFLLGEKERGCFSPYGELDTRVPVGIARLWDGSSGTQWGR